MAPVFDGIDTFAQVSLNGHKPSPGANDSQFGDEPKGVAASSYVRKALYHYGWDYGQRLVALGLWRPVRL